MPYTADIPKPTDIKSQSQGQMRNNFNSINTWVQVDHIVFDNAQEGKHSFVRFPNAVAAPAVIAGENALWNQNYATTTKNEVFIRKQNQAGEVNIPLTASVLGNVATPIGTDGWSYLPSGILIKWGRNNLIGMTTNINMNSGTPQRGPNFTEIFTVIASGESAPLTAIIHAVVSFPNITIDTTQFPISANWFVIGR